MMRIIGSIKYSHDLTQSVKSLRNDIIDNLIIISTDGPGAVDPTVFRAESLGFVIRAVATGVTTGITMYSIVLTGMSLFLYKLDDI
jgi:hypothetical protein